MNVAKKEITKILSRCRSEVRTIGSWGLYSTSLVALMEPKSCICSGAFTVM